MPTLVTINMPACSGCCSDCSLSCQTQSVSLTKCGYYGPATGASIAPSSNPALAEVINDFVAANCEAPSGYVAGTASLWYHNRQNCTIGYDGNMAYNSRQGPPYGPFTPDCLLDSFVVSGDEEWTPTDLAEECLTYEGGYVSWAPELTGPESPGTVVNQLTTDPATCEESPLSGAPEQNLGGGSTLSGTKYATPDCSGTGTPVCFYSGGVNPASGDCSAFGYDPPPGGGTTVNLGCTIVWTNQYLFDEYTDAELITNTAAKITDDGWADSDSCMASCAVDDSSSTCTMTALRYTISHSGDGTCYWTVRYTDVGGGITDTAMSGTGTFTITPDQQGTWEIVDLSGVAP